jgi:hypothetical protein
MKHRFSNRFLPGMLMVLWMVMIPFSVALAQEFDPEKTYVVIKNDGTRFVGQIISSDAREVHLRTDNLGEVIIPKHEIRSITEYTGAPEVYSEVFATRYFITTNGLPIDRGDSYIQWTLVGPDVHFGVADNMSIGVMTTWFATPVIGSFKYTGTISENRTYAIGMLAGTTLWNFGNSALIALPYAAYTLGDARANLNFAAGYGLVSYDGDSEGSLMFSVGGMRKVSRSGTLVLDSVMLVRDGESVLLLVPGIRLQTRDKSAFQFGFPGVISSDGSSPIGFPMVSWFRRL